MNKQKNRIYKFRIWEENEFIQGEVRLFDDDLIIKFRDLLIEDVKHTKGLELLKDKGHPTEHDSSYLLFEKDTVKDGHFLLETFNQEKSTKTWEAIKKLSSFQTGTSHDSPYVDCWSKIHNKKELMQVLKNVAQHLDIELEYFDLEEQRKIQERAEKTIWKILIYIAVIVFLILIITQL